MHNKAQSTSQSGRAGNINMHDPRKTMALLEQAILRNDTQTCSQLMQKVNVNAPLGRKQEPALVLAVKKHKLKMVRCLAQFDNSDHTKTMALEVAIGRASSSFDVVVLARELVLTGAYTISPLILGKFFSENGSNGQLCEEMLHVLCTSIKRTVGPQDNTTQIYKLLGTLLKMVMAIPYRHELELASKYQYIPGWDTYKTVQYLLEHGVSVESHWDPLFQDTSRSRYTNTILPIDRRVFCLFVRTALGKAVPYKVESLFCAFLVISLKYTGSSAALDILEDMLTILIWSGVPLKEMKIYELANTHRAPQSNTNTNGINNYKRIKAISDKVGKDRNMFTLQQCCRLVIQQNLNGPNLKYSLNTIEGLPKSMKDMILLENTDEVQRLESHVDVEELVSVHMAVSP